jgi:hypothetical protein
MIEEKNAVVGTRVKSTIDFSGVPRGTEGVIDEDYGTGIMVAWDLPESPLPKGYTKYDGIPAVTSGILRDGFDKRTELILLDPVYECIEKTSNDLNDFKNTLKSYLDNNIRYWRKQKKSIDSSQVEMASYYVDAYQSVRISTFGELLP